MCGAAAMGRCNRLIFQSMGEDSYARTVPAKGSYWGFFPDGVCIIIIVAFSVQFQQQHRSSCPLVELEAIPPCKHPSFSRNSMGMSLQMPPGRMGSISGAAGSSLYTVRGECTFSKIHFKFNALTFFSMQFLC